jgi:predicted transcriptional regulator
VRSTAPVTLRLSRELDAAVEALAAAESLSTGELVAQALTAELAREPEPVPPPQRNESRVRGFPLPAELAAAAAARAAEVGATRSFVLRRAVERLVEERSQCSTSGAVT